MTKFLISFLFILPFISCHNENAKLSGHYYTANSSRSNFQNANESNSDFKGHFVQESFIDLFENGSYSMYLNHYESGTYTHSNDTLSLTRSNGQQWKLVLKTEKHLNHFIFPDSKNLVTLRKIENEYSSDYPFIPENNQWRVKSTTSLSTNELINKFQAYNDYMIHFMRWSKNKDFNLSFKNISGPLQFANNGLMMRKLKDSGQWCTYFAENDCDKMDKILRHYFDGLIIDWKYTNNRIAMLCNGLEQVNKGIENHLESFSE
ncbi:hypothetical protein [Portibacter lacus]|uniref:Uncharacterized protein n=1 Tax=Portibacter lacus TaxID=1099794 RepID=A0AA37SNM0_9BACT|nr:hypothetical protein [Portibacter lacus]GLR18128.1 hypothetical protein GCM10007940_27430 [Portibacter lacus]